MQLIFVDQRERPGRTLYTSAVQFENFPCAIQGPFSETLKEVETALASWVDVEIAYIFARNWPNELLSISEH